jgi:acyl-homoserine lactone acylase PvdQ
MGQGRSRGRPLAAIAAAAAAGALAVTLLGVGSPAGASVSATLTAADPGGALEATIKRDAHGIPNIIGEDTYTCTAGGAGWLVVTMGSKSTPQFPVEC